MYLTRYDITALFGDATATEANPDGIAATFSDDFLTELIKDIARFRLLRLANPSQDYENAGKQYELAKASLKDIQKGIADPRWPYNDPTGETAPPSDQITIISNPARNNHY